MTSRQRRLVAVPVGAGLAVVLALAFHGLPAFGTAHHPYGDASVRAALALRHTANAVGSVTFDQRGLDTLFEEFILLAAVLGVRLLLRPAAGEHQGTDPDREPRSPAAVRATVLVLLGVTAVLSVSVVLHGHLSPGGGFQGGVLAASGLHLLYVGGGPRTLARFRPSAALELLEAAGAGGYVVIGLVGLVGSGSFLANDLPLGRTGSLLSAGTVPLLNIVVGFEVGAGLVLLLASYFAQERLAEGPR
ncbi:MAG TPA: MnhB domain-containing protein [Mycobacteriales bacterium]